VYSSLFDSRVRIAGFQYPRRRPEAQIVDVIADLAPPVRYAGRDDDDVAGLDHLLDHVGADRGTAARRTVQDLGHLGVRPRLAAVADFAAGHRRAAAGDDQVALGLLIVRDHARRAAARWRRRLFAARLALLSGAAPRATARTRRRAAPRSRSGACRRSGAA